MRFNPNDVVTVKLTAVGMLYISAAIGEHNTAAHRDLPKCTYTRKIPFNQDGIITNQFWCIMAHLGEYNWAVGKDVIFEWIEVIDPAFVSNADDHA